MPVLWTVVSVKSSDVLRKIEENEIILPKDAARNRKLPEVEATSGNMMKLAATKITEGGKSNGKMLMASFGMQTTIHSIIR